MNYEDDMRIDDTALDVECLDQGNLALRYGRIYTEAKKAVEEAEEEIKVIRSELIRDANEDPDKHLGIDVKPTGPNIEAFYRTHKDHKAVKQELIDLTYELNMAEIAKNEICFTRKAMLEALIRLHFQQYFAGPSVPRDLSFEAQKKRKQKKSDTGVASKLTRPIKRK